MIWVISYDLQYQNCWKSHPLQFWWVRLFLFRTPRLLPSNILLTQCPPFLFLKSSHSCLCHTIQMSLDAKFTYYTSMIIQGMGMKNLHSSFSSREPRQVIEIATRNSWKLTIPSLSVFKKLKRYSANCVGSPCGKSLTFYLRKFHGCVNMVTFVKFFINAGFGNPFSFSSSKRCCSRSYFHPFQSSIISLLSTKNHLLSSWSMKLLFYIWYLGCLRDLLVLFQSILYFYLP